MPASFKPQQTVKVIGVIPTGPVQKISMDEEGNIIYLVQWAAENGEVHESWFKEDALAAA
jgi:hypothetical protein